MGLDSPLVRSVASLHLDMIELAYVMRARTIEQYDDCKYVDFLDQNVGPYLLVRKESQTWHSLIKKTITECDSTVFAASQEFKGIAIVHCNSLDSISVTGIYMA
jgi:hypothetical protein